MRFYDGTLLLTQQQFSWIRQVLDDASGGASEVQQTSLRGIFKALFKETQQATGTEPCAWNMMLSRR